MSRVQLLQIDGKIPNLALMRLNAFFKSRGREVLFRHADSLGSVGLEHFESSDGIFASCIFSRSKPVVDRLVSGRPDAIVGGTGVDVPPLQISRLENWNIPQDLDYSIYPLFKQSIGFTQRGCRLNCSFCVVPQKEGKVKPDKTIAEIWRGDPWPRELLLLDNDFFGQPDWRARIAEIRDGGFKVSFNQGINARCITDEAAEAIASVNYRDDEMKAKRIYTAWDSREDEHRLFAGLNRLVKYGVKPDQIMVYMLIGYWPGETAEDREYRRAQLRAFGARPFPMAYITADTPPEKALELRGFQRWVIRRADVGRNACSWSDFVKARYRPEKIGLKAVSAHAPKPNDPQH